MSLLIAGIIGLQAWAVVEYRDDWPFASNSMFSFGRDPDDRVYDLEITVEVNGQWRRLEPREDVGAEDGESFRRLFFTRWYGSTDDEYPQRAFEHDDPAAFAARMTEFCATVAEEMATRGRPIEGLAIRIAELQRVDDHWTARWERPIGECNPIGEPFEARRA